MHAPTQNHIRSMLPHKIMLQHKIISGGELNFQSVSCPLVFAHARNLCPPGAHRGIEGRCNAQTPVPPNYSLSSTACHLPIPFPLSPFLPSCSMCTTFTPGTELELGFRNARTTKSKVSLFKIVVDRRSAAFTEN